MSHVTLNPLTNSASSPHRHHQPPPATMASERPPRAPHLRSAVDEDDGEDPSTSGCLRESMDAELGGHGPGRYSGRRGEYGRYDSGGLLWRILDPHAKWVREWNRVFLLVCAAALFVDPLFFYALSISGACVCLFLDGWFAITVTALRCMTDVLYVWNMCLQVKMACYARRAREAEEDHRSRGNGGRRAALRYMRSVKGFAFDLFVVLPIPQVMLWVVAPALLRRGSSTTVMTVFLVMFLVQYFPKVYHSMYLLRRMQNISGYIFGTIGWGVALNLICYFVTAHAAGACWYLLGIQRATRCLEEQCLETKGCDMKFLACGEPVYYGTSALVKGAGRMAWGNNTSVRATCLDSSDNYNYGVYQWAVTLVTNDNRIEKMLLPIFWAIMALSTFGDLNSTTDWLELVFNMIIITSGLVLVTMLIGNIKVFLHATSSKKQMMNLKMRNVEWWMKRRNLPQGFRQRVRHYERQRWAAMRGVDECQMIRNLPEGLRRDIKYYLCLDLVRQVPLFQHMDSVVLENICDRVKSLILPKGETITKEGDPVQRMLFVVRGHLQSSQVLRDGVRSCCMLGPGNFTGDELLSWCLRRPFVERLPPSSSTLVTLETTEAFGLEASDVKYVTQHFRYTFVNDKVKRSARYYSPGWRTWAAVAIQLAWRRHRHRMALSSLSFIRPRRPLSRSSSMGEDKLRLYTAMLTSPKPNQDDFTT
ncbi:hypothetical protein Taro_036280 [Colocasia esculenta]|uniref:Cyclic nucleotide-binding domain-containing protein n=1 Tax=Colocasia esculenta TaxID=4460 RepID=A0A843WHE7_COLES|nr:hypothetical protein [Colocasia esculenta]